MRSCGDAARTSEVGTNCCGRIRYSGALMSTFTGRDLEFLAGLNKSWWTLYWRELARLCLHAGIARIRREREVPPSPAEGAEADPAAVLHRLVELTAGNR